MAVLVQDKNQQQQYLIRCLQTFMFECGRAQATLSTTTLQSDQEEYIQNLLKAVAQRLGNVNIRQSPAYSSQSQGSIERFHRTLSPSTSTGTTSNHKLQLLSVQQPIMPWIVRRAAWLLNRYAMRNDGQTSYQRRWQKDHKAPLCEMAETVQRMIPTTKSTAQDGTKILQRNLAWQRYNDRRVNSWHPWQGHQSKNNTKTDHARQVRQATTGYDQCVSMELANLTNGNSTKIVSSS